MYIWYFIGLGPYLLCYSAQAKIECRITFEKETRNRRALRCVLFFVCVFFFSQLAGSVANEKQRTRIYYDFNETYFSMCGTHSRSLWLVWNSNLMLPVLVFAYDFYCRIYAFQFHCALLIYTGHTYIRLLPRKNGGRRGQRVEKEGTGPNE